MTKSRLLAYGASFCLASAAALATGGDEVYQRPSKEILDILDAPNPPSPILSPTGKHLLLATPLAYPPIADLAEPMLRLAGVRINPKNNAPHGARYYTSLSIMKLPDGQEIPIVMPAGSRIGGVRWNADGTRFAFTNMLADTVELWVADASTARARKVPGIFVNGVLSSPILWMPDQRTLLVKTVPTGRGKSPESSPAPKGPRIESGTKVATASSTYESRDLLKTPHDGDLFEYHATSQLVTVDLSDDEPRIALLGSPGVLAEASPSPDGRFLLVQRVDRPYSFLRPYYRFPMEVQLWDRSGAVVETLASLPVAEQVPIHGERTGQRDHSWVATQPATLVWAEALDGGDTYKKDVPHHDKVMIREIGGTERELTRTQQRFGGLDWLEDGDRVLASEYDQDKHWSKTWLMDVAGKAEPRLLWSLSWDDRYGNPGQPVHAQLPNGQWVVLEHAGSFYTSGEGSTETGDRPFLDRVSLKDFSTERLFRSDAESLESFVDWLSPSQGTFLTLHQSPTDPPNVYLRTLGGVAKAAKGESRRQSSSKIVTSYRDPTPQLRQLTKKLVKYSRPDGVPLSFTLYLPPGYREGTRLPTVVWAYPLDYTDPSTAGQVEGSTKEFTIIRGASPLFLALAGYAVLDNAAMPVVGPSETVYDTMIEQITMNAQAAIDEAVEMGVTDRDRVGVMGHSHGALMTANLLAWTDLFRAGVARSGAYNHTLRPFGFQNERRTLYAAPESYTKLSPLIHANQIDEPLLLIHGELDANPGTVTLQSEKLFEALRGVGGTTRLVILPFESHGYQARESNEHVIWETIDWMDRHVKNAPPRMPSGKPASAAPLGTSGPPAN